MSSLFNKSLKEIFYSAPQELHSLTETSESWKIGILNQQPDVRCYIGASLPPSLFLLIFSYFTDWHRSFQDNDYLVVVCSVERKTERKLTFLHHHMRDESRSAFLSRHDAGCVRVDHESRRQGSPSETARLLHHMSRRPHSTVRHAPLSFESTVANEKASIL